MNSTKTLAADHEAADEATRHGLLPGDEHDLRLVGNVCPPEWENPEPAGRYHLVVVGGGTAGLVTSVIAASLGARVALVERKLLGGDCLNFGCVPSKALIRAARAWCAADEAADRFGGPTATGPGDFAAAMERMRRVRSAISVHDAAARFRDLGIDVFLGEGVFAGRDTLAVGGQVLRFRRGVIATGSRPAAPNIPGLAEADYLTNETIFGLTELPRRLAVIGGGPIGAEMAQAFARFGSRVQLLEAADRILIKDDADAAAIVHDALERDAVEIVCSATVTRVERSAAGTIIHYTQNGGSREAAADRLLVAVGRVPNIERLGLEAAGVRFDARTGVETDNRLRTSNPRIYAIGDVASRYQFTHVADAQARLVVRNALFYGRARASRLVIPWCTYTSPELAHVGITADEVRERGDQVETVTVPMEAVDCARLDGETAGFLRIHLEAGTDRILGATLVAQHAGELISQITQAMTAGVRLGKLSDTIFPYPTRAEVVRKAADQWRRGKLTPRVQRVFRWFFRVVS